MPLDPRASVGTNIKEFRTGKTFAHTKAKFGAARAQKQAIAVAMSTARKYGKQSGGSVGPLDLTPPSLLPLPRRRPILDPPLPQRAPIEARLDPIYQGERYDDSPTYDAKVRALGSRMAGKGVYGTPVYTPKHPKDEPGREIHPMTIAPPEERYLAEGGKSKALGGPNLSMEGAVVKGSMYGLRHEGMINSSIPGRTDKLPMSVKSGSYILPADIPSALGQGNSMAGGEILKKMFSSGPYGMAAPHIRAGRSNFPKLNLRTPPPPKAGAMPKFKEGGDAEGESESHVPIIAAGGEYIIHPDVVRDLGHGDIDKGHEVLDAFVLHTREQNIKTLKKLKPPKK